MLSWLARLLTYETEGPASACSCGDDYEVVEDNIYGGFVVRVNAPGVYGVSWHDSRAKAHRAIRRYRRRWASECWVPSCDRTPVGPRRKPLYGAHDAHCQHHKPGNW